MCEKCIEVCKSIYSIKKCKKKCIQVCVLSSTVRITYCWQPSGHGRYSNNFVELEERLVSVFYVKREKHWGGKCNKTKTILLV